MQYIGYVFNIIKSYIFDIYYFLSENLEARKNASSYQVYRSTKLYPDYLKKGNASDSIKYLAKKYCSGKGLDIGAGQWPFGESRAIEDNTNENAYNLNEMDNSLDYIFSSHLLEHLEKPYHAIDLWCSKLKNNGILFLYLPHPVCRMWKKENLKFHLWNPNPFDLEVYFKKHKYFDIVEMTYQPDAYLSFSIILEKK